MDLKILAELKIAAQYLLDNDSHLFSKEGYYTCHILNKEVDPVLPYYDVTISIENLSVQFITDVLKCSPSELGSAFINNYVDFELDLYIRKEVQEALTKTRTQWLQFIVDYQPK